MLLLPVTKSDDISILSPTIYENIVNKSNVNLSYKILRNGMLYTTNYTSELRDGLGNLIWYMFTEKSNTNITYELGIPGNYTFSVFSGGEYIDINAPYKQYKQARISETVNFTAI